MKSFIFGLLFIFLSVTVVYTTNRKITICHQGHTISIDEHALDGHFYHNGATKPGHSEDHLGSCAAPSPVPSPLASPSTSPEPTGSPVPSVSPLQSTLPSPEPSSSVQPTTQPSYRPDPTLAPEHDYRSDGYSSDPEATKPHIVNYSDEHPENGKPSKANK